MTRILRRIVLACLVLSVSPRAHARVEEAGPLTGCPPGSYRFIVNGDSRLRQVDLADGTVALVPGCRATKAELTVGERASTLLAEWPSCEGMSQHVKLEGRIHGASCERFDGTVQAGKDKPRTVHADLVACRVRYPDESERKATVARAVDACMAELHGDPWKDAQDFGRLYYAVQAKLGCALGP